MKRIEKHFALLLVLLMLLSVLGGCAQTDAVPQTTASTAASQAPEAAAQSTEDTASLEALSLVKCRTALEDIQSYDVYEVHSANQFEGDVILNETSDSFYLKDGEDWYLGNELPESGVVDGVPVWLSIMAYLCVDGEYYNTEREGYVDAYLTYHWGESQAPADLSPWFYEFRAPWLYSFDWDAQEITWISTVEAGVGQSIRFQVQAPYAEDNESTDYTDSYTVEMYFDGQDRFEKAVVRYYAMMQGSQSGFIRTETLTSTDSEWVAARIQDHYQAAKNGCGDKSCTVCYP